MRLVELSHTVFGYLLGFVLLAVAMGLFAVQDDVPALHHLINSLEYSCYDALFAARGPQPVEEKIVILGIDETAVDFFTARGEKYPFRNRTFAQVISELKRLGAKLIIFDKMFKDPTEDNSREDEELLGQAARAAGNVIFPCALQSDQELQLDQEQTIRVSRTSLEMPLEEVRRGSTIGYVNLPRDDDGAIRRATLIKRYQDNLLYSLDMRAYLAVNGVSPEQVTWQPGQEVSVGDVRVPLDRYSAMYINYLGASIPTPSMAQLFQPESVRRFEAEGTFRQAIVYVGATLRLVHDDYLTPFSYMHMQSGVTGMNSMYGVEIHANILHTLLQGSFIRPLPQPLQEIMAILLGTLVVILSGRGRLSLRLLISIGALLAVFLVVRWLWNIKIYAESVRPVAHMFLPFLGTWSYRFMYEMREKRRLRRLFHRHVSKEVAEELIRTGDSLHQAVRRQELTVMFCDIREFTPLAEQARPEELVGQLNEFFTAMTEVIFAHQGMVDKFVGDAIMAVFGAPKALPDHAQRACAAALEMQRRLQTLNALWLGGPKPQLRVGIGINSGEVVLGSVGSQERSEYTVLGDHVNLASRIESLNKEFNTTIIISEYTLAPVAERAEVKFLGEIRVKGKNIPVKVYELLGLSR